ncbi:DUF6973 domain-containing protein [Dyadobacter psychrotolerans]|uniref:DUF6973 domain-containing protein n=1 Tax=Dyadobacter psychrotolerans TaxID=2541721 RepID=A0A4R5DMQ3_9BACT|nr:hypothetical protein [Dyadobacter psychrotolerans]TDE11973.1 hypothetical protein E0F88_23240 [Dyadobacter psychrotolerans]
MGFIKDKSKIAEEDLITPVQLVVYLDGDGKEVVERMYTKTDAEYRKQKKSKDKDFTGMHWFEDTEGHFKRGFVYKNGELVQTLLPKDIGQQGNLRTSCGLILQSTTIDYYSIACSSNGCGPPQFMYTESFSYYVADRNCEQNKHDTEYAPSGSGGSGGDTSGGDQNQDDTVTEGWAVPEDRISQFNAWLRDLNPRETAWLKANPGKAPAAWFNTQKAENQSRSEYMCQKDGIFSDWIVDIDGTNQNAFKHAYWNAMNYNSFGEEEAKIIGDNHEGDWTVKTLDIDMDLQNNALGRKVAQTCGCSGIALRDAVLKAIKDGRGKRNSIGVTGKKEERLISTSSATTFCNDN